MVSAHSATIGAIVTTRRERTDFLPGIQALRALAALLVLACHVIAEFAKNDTHPAKWDNIYTFGTSGVDLFFSISGFVIFYTTFKSNGEIHNPIKFLKLRATRIYPLYWLTLVFILLVHSIGFLKDKDITLVSFALDAALLPTDDPLLSISWTLTYEIFFYLIFATTLRLRSMSLSLVLSTGLIIVALVGGRLLPEGALRGFLTYNVMIEFCLGMGLAFAFLKWPNMPLPKTWMVAPLMAMVAAVPWLVVHDEGYAPEPRALLWGLPCVAIVACAIRGQSVRSWVMRPILLLGGASYAIYLLHPLALLIYGYVMREGLAPSWSWAALGCLTFTVSIGAGIAAHVLLERPVMRWLRGPRDANSATPPFADAPAPPSKIK